MDVIRNISHNEIVKVSTPVLITWHDGQFRLCGDFRELNNYKKDDSYSIPRIPHALGKPVQAKYITKMDCMKVSHPWGQAGIYQSLQIEDLLKPNKQGSFMEDPPNTVSNLNTTQYSQNPHKGFTKYRPVLNTGENTCIDKNGCIEYINTGLNLK
ncbi:hypothetical protein O181_004720 [Austropuccinia psidii MF-1]|uniref:Uncharacterized protein n=1 Tax=Austropuccinia psidii MF-1 TaxID=1389203 RepID=A0A9Q3BGZ4_9BASI|nr:hypothetical protein [Austropuccinia psidii MF-1]